MWLGLPRHPSWIFTKFLRYPQAARVVLQSRRDNALGEAPRRVPSSQPPPFTRIVGTFLRMPTRIPMRKLSSSSRLSSSQICANSHRAGSFCAPCGFIFVDNSLLGGSDLDYLNSFRRAKSTRISGAACRPKARGRLEEEPPGHPEEEPEEELEEELEEGNRPVAKRLPAIQ